MGAAESGFESVESLAATLRGVEERLLRAEELTFQHRAPSSADSCVLVNNVQVQTDPDLLLSTGPILGKVTLNSVRLLTVLQTAGRARRSARLSFNIFKVDALSMRSTFMGTDYMDAVTNESTVHSITGLDPDTHYAVFIGGVEAKHVFEKFLFFQTLPSDHKLVRLGCIRSARADLSVPDELDLTETLKSLIPRYRADHSLQNESELRPLHVILFVGGFQSLGAVFQKLSPRILKALFECAFDDSIWIDALSEFRAAVSRQYQLCFQEEAFGLICRRCSCYFFGDIEEKLTDEICALIDHNPYIEERDADIRQELTNLTIAATKLITKTLRQVNMAYYRALWDEYSSAYISLNEAEIEDLSAEIRLRRAHICRLQECRRAAALFEAVVKRSGPTAGAAAEIEAYVAEVSALRDEALEELKQFIVSTPPPVIVDDLDRASLQSPNLALGEAVSQVRRTTVPPYSNHAVVDLDKCLLLFVDSSWESLDDAVHDTGMTFALDFPLSSFFNEKTLGNLRDRSEVKAIVIVTVRNYLPPANSSGQLLRSDLLTRLAKWRQSGEDRSVFLIVPAPSDASQATYSGLLSPIRISGTEGSAEESPYWEQGKCELSCVGLGNFKGNRRAQSSVGRVMSVGGQLPSEGEGLLQFISELSDLSNRNSFWTIDLSEGLSRFDDSLDHGLVEVVTGPTVGWCSPHSAAILLEVNSLTSGSTLLNCEVQVVDTVSSSTITCFKLFERLRPSILVVDKLLPGRCYDIYLNSWRESKHLNYVHKRVSFRTPRRTFTIQTHTEVGLPRDQPRLDEVLYQPFGSSESFSILFCSASGNKSTSRFIDAQWSMYLAQQASLQYKTNEMLANPSAPVDLVVHFGLAACFDAFRDTIVTALARAESEPSKVEAHLLEAEEAYRDAMRLYYASNIAPTCRHMFVSSPALDLMKVFECSSLEEIRRGYLSDYCLRELIRIADKLYAEYLQSLWSPHAGTVDSGTQNGHLLFDDTVLVYPLQVSKEIGVSSPIGSRINTDFDEHLSLLRHTLRNQSDVQQVLLFSGIPIITGDVTKDCHADDQAFSPRYSLQFVKTLFRIVSEWLFETSSRRCILIAETEEAANICEIEIHHREDVREIEQLCISGPKVPPIWSSGGHSFPGDSCSFKTGEFSVSYRFEEWTGPASDIAPCLLYLEFEKIGGILKCKHAFHLVETIKELSPHKESSQALPLLSSPWLEKLKGIVIGNAFTEIPKSDANEGYDNSGDSINISFAVRDLFETHKDVLQALHHQFSHGHYGVPRGSTIDQCIFSISWEFYNRIPAKVRIALNVPSSLVVSWVWKHFIGKNVDSQALSSEKVDYAYSNLCRQEGLFTRLIRQMFETMLLLNHLASKEGYS